MIRRLTSHFPHYFHRALSRSLGALYVSVGLQDFAIAAMILFEPVFLYQLGYNIPQIALFYALVYLGYLILMPLGGKFVARFGPPKAIALSTVFLVGYYLALLGIQNMAALYWIAPLLFSWQKSLYWPAYHADFIGASDQGERGKEFSGLYTVSTLMYIIGPAVGGLIIAGAGFTTLFMIGAGIVFLSSFPLFFVRSNHQRQSFSYWQSFSLPFIAVHRRTTLSYLAFGQQLLYVYIWPVYLIIAFATVTELGGLIALTTLITAIITLIVGRLFDRGRWRGVLRYGAALNCLSWLTRPWLSGGPAVFTSDVAGRISDHLTWVTASDVTYERAIQEQDVLRRSIMLEQGLSYGKIIAALLVATLGLVWPPFTVTFIVGAVFSLLFFIFR